MKMLDTRVGKLYFHSKVISTETASNVAMIVNVTTVPETDTEQRTLHQILPPYAVILHDDDYHAMDFVVGALVKSVSSLSIEEAIKIMMETHFNGQSVVITCPLEQAELYRDRIRTFGLHVTIEKA